jgi:kinesin family member C1
LKEKAEKYLTLAKKYKLDWEQVSRANADGEKARAELLLRHKELEGELCGAETERDDAVRAFGEAKRASRTLENSLDAAREQHTVELRRVEASLGSVSAQLAESRAEASDLRAERTRNLRQIDEHVTALAELRAALAERDASIAVVGDKLGAREKTIGKREQRIVELMSDVERLEADKQASEAMRRTLHNRIQELKGNIRVMCRVRPELSTDADGDSIFNFRQDGRSLELTSTEHVQTAMGTNVEAKRHSFNFDKVFAGASQADVFEEISQLVQSALDGYNVCIFAYGQTGSGKTYTMEGPGGEGGSDESKRGMIPRAVEQIFASADQLAGIGWQYEFKAEMLEVYNETIYDLFEASGGRSSMSETTSLSSSSSSGPYEIKLTRGGDPFVTNTNIVTVKYGAHVHALLKRAAKRRAVAATNKNDRSSRSHSIFRLHLKGTNSRTGNTVTSLLNLVDLAGSERLKQSGAQGARLRETQAINKSLSCLGDVIAALANNDKHVPFRNSKLTKILSSSLGGNAKTLMFVNASGDSADYDETISSLRFAAKVSTCDIGVARKSQRVKF